MYVYIRNWNIVHKSKKKKLLIGFLEGCQILEEKDTDRCIYENGKIVKYEKSKQREEDSNKYHLMNENNLLKKENNKLEKIAKIEVKKKSNRYWNWEKLTDFEKNIYLLNHLKEC